MNLVCHLFPNFRNFWQQSVRFSNQFTKKYDSDLVKKLSNKIDNERIFKDVSVENFIHLLKNENDQEKIQHIINTYENMKYNLEDVPSILKDDDIQQLLIFTSFTDIKRYIKKLYRKELNQLLKKELKIYDNSNKKKFENENRSGLFDNDGNLIYGLWHNTLFTRFADKLKRITLDKYRLAETLGQNVFIDFSYSEHLTYHLSTQVANDLLYMINFNYKELIQPFKICLCGVDYNHNLWKLLSKNFPFLIDLIEHTSKSYLELTDNKNKIAYFTSLEKNNILEYDSTFHYVMPALSEKNIHKNFLIPSLKKMNVNRYGVPIDQYVIWGGGTKRLSLKTKLQILNDVCDKKDWKQIITTNIHPKKIKSKELVLDEDSKRILKKKSSN